MLSHTIFGLPFVVVSAILADRQVQASGAEGLSWSKALWILLAFSCARTAAMAFNRIVDRHLDASNPRTAQRELPSGKVSLRSAILLTCSSTLLFLVSAWALGPIPLALSPLCLAIIFAYSFFKRFSWLCHLILGLALALAPGGAWLAITGHFSHLETPIALMLAVASWVAGFDIIYSLQDREHDQSTGLHSIPVRFGAKGALILSALLHMVTVAMLICVHFTAKLGSAHLCGIALISLVLVYEHWIVRPSDLSRINRAFFDLNGWISMAYLASILVPFSWDYFLRNGWI